MKYYLDSADPNAVKTFIPYGIQGVTCNPSIVKKDKVDILKLSHIVPETMELFIQVIAKDATGMVEEGKRISSLRKNTIPKIPATREGLLAIKELRDCGVKVLATAIYSVQQAVFAAACGASYVAPYVNRISDTGADGVKAACDIQKIFTINGTDCEVLGASFKNLNQVTELMTGGVRAVTIGADLMEKIVDNPLVSAANDVFVQDWKETTGLETLSF